MTKCKYCNRSLRYVPCCDDGFVASLPKWAFKSLEEIILFGDEEDREIETGALML